MVMVEGYFDCLSLHQHGIENVVASCGTALTPQQVDLAARYAPEVVMNYDPDAAGQNAIRRSIDLLLEKGLRVRVLKLPGSLDPDDFVRKEGGEVYRRLLDAAPPFWQYLMADAAGRFDLGDPSAKADAVRETMDHVAKIQDPVERLEVAKSVAQGFKIPEGLVLDRLRMKGRPAEVAPGKRAETPVPAKRLANAERQLIQALTQIHGEGQRIGRELRSLCEAEFWKDAWSWPAIEALILEPESSLVVVLERVEDEELRKQIREAALEQVGALTIEHAMACVHKLYDGFLVKRELEIREQLKQCGPGGAPAELLERHRGIVTERNRMAEALKPRR
jgi:DNA primase